METAEKDKVRKVAVGDRSSDRDRYRDRQPERQQQKQKQGEIMIRSTRVHILNLIRSLGGCAAAPEEGHHRGWSASCKHAKKRECRRAWAHTFSTHNAAARCRTAPQRSRWPAWTATARWCSCCWIAELTPTWRIRCEAGGHCAHCTFYCQPSDQTPSLSSAPIRKQQDLFSASIPGSLPFLSPTESHTFSPCNLVLLLLPRYPPARFRSIPPARHPLHPPLPTTP